MTVIVVMIVVIVIVEDVEVVMDLEEAEEIVIETYSKEKAVVDVIEGIMVPWVVVEDRYKVKNDILIKHHLIVMMLMDMLMDRRT